MRIQFGEMLIGCVWTAFILNQTPLAFDVALASEGQQTTTKMYRPKSHARTADTEKIIGKNDLIPVLNNGSNIPTEYADIIDAFGKMSMGCTATHIGQGIVLSAGHCFRAPKQRTSLGCDDVKVEWGVRRDTRPYLISKCTQVLAARTTYEEDYAVFRVEPIPSAYVDFNFDTRPTVNTSLTQFSHPRARALEWSQHCTLQTSAQGGWGSKQFSHDCDSEPGSSGAALIDVTSMKVVGIHDGGLGQWNYGTFLIDTPLNEYIGSGNSAPRPVPEPTKPIQLPQQKFGPFPNSSSFVLTDFGTDLGRVISFDLFIDFEEGKDFLTVEYGYDQKMELTGFQKRYFRDLTLPVKVSFRSSKFVRSNLAVFENIRVWE